MRNHVAAAPVSSADLRLLAPFSLLTDEDLGRLFSALEPRSLRAGASIDLARDFVGLVGVVWSGLFVTTVSLPPRRTVALSRLKSGAGFAHMPKTYGSFFGDGHRLRCVRSGVILQIEGEVFAGMIATTPALAQAMLSQTTLAAAEYASRVYEMSALSARERIQAELLRLARDGDWIGCISRITPRPTHQEIADQVGVAREVATRCLNVLASEGVIRLVSDALEVIDVDGLLRMDHAATGRRLFDPEEYARSPSQGGQH